MSEPINWVFETSIHPGKLGDFKALAADLIKQTEAESGMLIYEWYYNSDETTCTVLERYRDSEAIIRHLVTFTPFIEPLMKVSTPIRLSVYGDVSDEVKTAMAAVTPLYHFQSGGFRR